MQLLITWAALTLGMFVASQLLPRMKIKGGVRGHLAVSAVFGLLFGLTGWLVEMALGAMSFGLLTMFSVVGQVLVGAVLLKATSVFSDRLEIRGFRTALVASVIVAVMGGLTRVAVANVLAG